MVHIYTKEKPEEVNTSYFREEACHGADVDSAYPLNGSENTSDVDEIEAVRSSRNVTGREVEV